MRNIQQHADSNLVMTLVGTRYEMADNRVLACMPPTLAASGISAPIELLSRHTYTTSHMLDSVLQMVSEESAQALADEYQISFFETSARTGHNVDLVFQDLATQIIRQKIVGETARLQNAAIGATIRAAK